MEASRYLKFSQSLIFKLVNSLSLQSKLFKLVNLSKFNSPCKLKELRSNFFTLSLLAKGYLVSK